MKHIHLILTRFNLRQESLNKDKNRNVTLSPEWYEERFRLFDDICYPSVKNQINRNFKWYIFFDVTTPERYLEKIRRYDSNIPEIHTMFLDGMGEFDRNNGKLIEAHASQDADLDFLITSRLDNDDGLHENFTSMVAEYAKGITEPTIIDFNKGYLLNKCGEKDLIRKKTDFFGPFITLVEPIAQRKTVFYMKHRHFKKARKAGSIKVIQDSKNFMWVQTIHNRNVSNRMKNEEFLCPKDVLRGFHIDPAKLNTDYSLFFVVLDYLKVSLVKIIKSYRVLKYFRKLKNLTAASA